MLVKGANGQQSSLPADIVKHDNHTILYDYAKQKQNYCSLDLTSLFHHTLGFMLLAYTGKCPQADPAKRTTDKTSSAVTTQFVLKLWLLRRDIIKIETGICVAFLLQVRLSIVW